VGTINHAHGEEKSPEIKIYFLAFPMCLRSFAQWESVVINGLEGRKLEVICLMDRRLPEIEVEETLRIDWEIKRFMSDLMGIEVKIWGFDGSLGGGFGNAEEIFRL
jgi:hypothetical protein